MQPSNTIIGTWHEGAIAQVQNLTGTAFTEEDEAHTFRISAEDANGDPASFTGTVTALFLRADETTIAIDGSLDSGAAVITLVADCYHVPGRFTIAIYVTSGGVSTCVYAAVGTVFRTSSDTVLDSGAEIPTLAELQEAYSDCVTATAAAQAIVDNWSIATLAETKSYLGYT